MRQKVGFIFLHTLLMCTLYSCKSDNTANTAFDDKIILIENNPQQYLARIDTIRPNSVNDEKEATDFLLYSLAHNYINRNYYPSKELLLTSIQTFQRRNLPQQQLEALFLLAKIYRKEQDLSSEVHTIENAVRIAKSEEDSEWLFYLYSYLGDMYIRQYNTLKFRVSRFFVGIIFYLREVLLTSRYEKRLFGHASQPCVAGTDIRLLPHLRSRTNLSRDSYPFG